MLQEVDVVLAQHQQWLDGVLGLLVCNQADTLGEDGVGERAFTAFEHWYGKLPKAVLRAEEIPVWLNDIHRQMQMAANALLQTRRKGQPVVRDEYENFIALANDFRKKLRGYQFELLQRICSVDQLTGAWNRNSMLSRLEAEAERARRGHKDFAICLLDLDHFKRINDQLGHRVGDQVLHSVARFLRDNLRAYDSLFRYGGEEFLICLPDTDTVKAEKLLNRLREKLSGSAPCQVPNAELRVTASFGVTNLSPDGNIDEAIERADHALLCAKSRGRNAVCAWDIGAPPPAGGLYA
jgi:diguanylate cyclase (GGDEF)-like protein